MPSPFSRLLERRGADGTLPWGNWVPPRNGELGGMAAGIQLNDDTALSLTTVSTCVSLITDGLATLPVLGLKDTKDRSKVPLDSLPPLIKQPFPDLPRTVFWSQVMVSLLLRGNFFGRIVDRDADGYAQAVMPIHPDAVVARRRPDTGNREYRVWGVIVPTADIVHITSPMVLPGGFIGMNPVEYQRQTWANTAAAEKYAGQFFANSANPSGVIQVPGDLSPDRTVEMARDWKMAHGGLGNAQFPAVLTGGAEFKPVSLTPDDAQFLQTRGFQQQQIISWFRVPPHKIGVQDRSPTPTSVEELNMDYVTEGLLPWAVRIEDVWNNLLRPKQMMKFDFTGRLRGNSLARAQAGQIRTQSGSWTPDEWRAAEDEPPLPNGIGNVVGLPMNMMWRDASSGKPINMPDPTKAPPNPSGNGQGGGDPANSPKQTGPDVPNQ